MMCVFSLIDNEEVPRIALQRFGLDFFSQSWTFPHLFDISLFPSPLTSLYSICDHSFAVFRLSKSPPCFEKHITALSIFYTLQ